MSFITKTCFLAFMFVSTFSLKVTFERAYLIYLNPEYVEYGFTNVTRYGRRSAYYVNIEFISRYDAGNNVTVDDALATLRMLRVSMGDGIAYHQINILFYEQRRNEYVRSFVELHYKACDFLVMDPYIGRLVTAVGITCPIRAHIKYSMKNLTINLEDFPNVFPFEVGRIHFCFNRTSDGEPLAEGVLHLKFINDAKAKKNG